jgi:DNA-binding NarL/FixJ family response regulator
MNRTRSLLVEGDTLLRDALVRLLASEADLTIAAQCATPAEAIEAFGRIPVDLVLVEAGQGFDEVNEFVALARTTGYAGKFLLMTSGFNRQSSLRALQLGVSGILLKSRGLERMLRAVRLVASGEAWMDRDVIEILANPPGEALTAREQQVLHGVLDALTNKMIAERMGVPESTVKGILRRIYQRSGIRSRAQLTRAALEGSLGAK